MVTPAARHDRTVRDLLHHGLAGAVLGFPLSIWLSGALIYYAFDAPQDSATYQVTMWIVPLLWICATALALCAPNRRGCWVALLLGNALAYGLCKVMQT